MPSRLTRLTLASALVGALPSSTAARPPDPTTWIVVDGGTRVGITSWGPDCGPRPRDRTARRGTRYRQVADALVPVAGAPPLFGPGICRAATGLRQLLEGRSAGGFDCRQRADSPKQVTGRIERQQTGTRQVVRHRFDYRWQLKGSQCSLLVQGTWQLDQVGGARTAATPAPPSAAAETDLPTAPVARCAVLGAPATVRIAGPAERESVPSATHALRAEVRDAAGCRLRARVAWQASAGQIDPRGRFTSPISGEARVEARAGDARAAVRFRVRLPEENLAAAPPSLEAPAERRSTSRGAARVSSAADAPADDPLPWLRIGFVLLAALAGATVYRLIRPR